MSGILNSCTTNTTTCYGIMFSSTMYQVIFPGSRVEPLPLLVKSGVSWTKCLVDQPPPCCGDMNVLLPEIDSVLLKSFIDNLYSVTSSSEEE